MLGPQLRGCMWSMPAVGRLVVISAIPVKVSTGIVNSTSISRAACEGRQRIGSSPTIGRKYR